MSFDDLGSSAWADTSPSASPKLENDDIWASTRGTRIPDLSPGGFGAELGEEPLELIPKIEEPQDVSVQEERLGTPTESQSLDLNSSQNEANIESLRIENNGFDVQSTDSEGQTVAAVNPQQEDDDFDDDDDDFEFGDAPAAQPTAADEFDDFGDFGDFDDGAQEGTGQLVQNDRTGQDSFEDRAFVEEPAGLDNEVWEDSNRPLPAKALHLNPRDLPSKCDLRSDIDTLLSPVFPILSPSPPFDIRDILTDEPIRQVAGLGQILFSEESRDLYAQLITPPVLKPLDWTRSRVRREQLISLGVPVNLDEVDSHRLSALPPLRIGTNAEAGPGPRTSSARGKMEKNGKLKTEKLMGPRPEFNRERCGKLLNYREDQLSLVPPKYLSRMQEDLVQACSEAASLLAWLKEIKEVRGEENKRRNETIAGLIASAQKYKASEMSSGGLFRKGSVKRSGSGSQTPKRTSSPIIGR